MRQSMIQCCYPPPSTVERRGDETPDPNRTGVSIYQAKPVPTMQLKAHRKPQDERYIATGHLVWLKTKRAHLIGLRSLCRQSRNLIGMSRFDGLVTSPVGLFDSRCLIRDCFDVFFPSPFSGVGGKQEICTRAVARAMIGGYFFQFAANLHEV